MPRCRKGGRYHVPPWVVPLLLLTNALGEPASGMAMAMVALRLVLALALLGGFIALLTRIKSFRFPGDEFLLKDFDVGTLGIVGLCFAAAALSSVGLLWLSYHHKKCRLPRPHLPPTKSPRFFGVWWSG